MFSGRVRADSFAEPSLCSEVSGDYGLASFARPQGPIYYVALVPARSGGLDPTRQSQSSAGYEFPMIDALRPVQGQIRPPHGSRFFDHVIENHVLPQKEFAEYERAVFTAFRNGPSA